ncbi:MAG: DNA translocase FtsK, partial [Sphingobacteriales bacterium]
AYATAEAPVTETDYETETAGTREEAEMNGAAILAQYQQETVPETKKNPEPLALAASAVPAYHGMEQEETEEDLDEDEEADNGLTNIGEDDDFLEELKPLPKKGKEKQEFSFEVIQQEEERIAVDSHSSIGNLDEQYAPELDLPSYKFPTLDLLEDRNEIITLDKDELEKNKNQIIQTLRSFGIEIQRISATVGPTVTLYEIVPAEGVRISKIRNLEDDIALNLAALGIRIIAPIPGKGTIGIEVPNANKQIVSMKALLSSEKFVNSKMSLPIALGKKIDNENYIVDLATMPHLLMAGATGQGKSVGINAILVSLLYKKHPSQLKFVMVDPKKVELSIYRVIEKHFLAKLPNEEEAIITDTKKVIYTLNALCIEMDNRYELLKEAGARNIKEYNEKFINRRLNPLRGHKYLPFIVLVIDEFADLIMTAGKEVEMPIARLAQLARAVGIHLIIATQRPSVNVITGTIKANFPGRIAFKVSAKVDSRTILDAGGAEQLIGRGDMLVSHGSELLRLQCAFVDTPEVEKVVDFIGTQRGYPTAFELPEYEGEEDDGNSKIVDLTNRDKLFEDCAKVVVQTQSGSTSMLQRRFNLGYNRAGRIMDQLEAAGIVGPAMGSKPRDVLFHTEAELSEFLSSLQ